MFNILVVEDNLNTRKLMEDVLLDERYCPLLAAYGQAALVILEH